MMKEKVEILGARQYSYVRENTGETINGTKVYIDLLDNDYGTIAGKSIKVLDYKDNLNIFTELENAGLEKGHTINGTAVYGRDFQSEKLVFMKLEFDTDNE